LSTPSYVAEPQIQRLSQIVREIADGFIQVPRFQRPIVWKNEQRLELFRSILEGTPIGSILVWRTTLRKIQVFDRLGPHKLSRPEGLEDRLISYLLDGHQRLSTLFGALHPLDDKEQSSQDRSQRWLVYFDLEQQDFTFDPGRDRTKRLKMLPLHKILDTRQYLAFQRQLQNFDDCDGLIARADELSTAIQEYKLPVIPIVTDEITVATRTFQRINSEGTAMNHVHMVTALTWTSEFDLVERLAAVREDVLAPEGWESFEDKLLLSACKLTLGLDLMEGDADEIARRINERREVLEETARHVARAARFLREYCHLGSPRLVSYSYVPVMLGEAFRLNPEPDKAVLERLVRWFWWVCYAYFPIGANSSRLRRALDLVRNIAKGREVELDPIDQLEPIPARFDFRLARCKLLSLLMAAERRKAASNGQVMKHDWGDADGLLATRGYEALQNLYSSKQLNRELFKSPANRVLVTADRLEALREHLRNQEEYNHDLRGFVISDYAWLAFKEGDPEEFIVNRLEALQNLERELGKEQGFLR
jgi:hypothetical protein